VVIHLSQHDSLLPICSASKLECQSRVTVSAQTGGGHVT
jgi:hypothetical protein